VSGPGQNFGDECLDEPTAFGGGSPSAAPAHSRSGRWTINGSKKGRSFASKIFTHRLRPQSVGGKSIDGLRRQCNRLPQRPGFVRAASIAKRAWRAGVIRHQQLRFHSAFLNGNLSRTFHGLRKFRSASRENMRSARRFRGSMGWCEKAAACRSCSAPVLWPLFGRGRRRWFGGTFATAFLQVWHF